VSGTIGDLTERELIARIQSHLLPPPRWMVVGIGDDAAVIEPERNRLEVFSADALVEAVHFDRRFTPPAAIGHRALAVNLSDLAAMGAAPRLALLSFALPPTLPRDDFDGIISGLAALAARHRLHVAGGNLTRSPGPLTIDITIVGSVKRRQTLTRRGAMAGDHIYVSGSIGAAAAGLQMLQAAGRHDASGEICVQRYLYPEPRVRLGTLLGRNRAASACMDLSDGLADGVRQIAEASGVGMTIDAEALPIEPGARSWFASRGEDAVLESLTGGDDYELIFTVRPRQGGRLKPASRHGEVPLTRIGVCTAGPAVTLRRMVNGTAMETPIPSGFSHFR
jgi:thiamine-monophosphate kinase